MRSFKIAAAFVIIVITATASQDASADNWGCTVLLCLADASGPMTQPDCRAPIQKLYRELALGRGMPSCSQNAGEGNFAKLSANPYPLCPQGLQEFTGWVASADRRQSPWLAAGYADLYGSGRGYYAKACVGKFETTYKVPQKCTWNGDSGESCVAAYTVNVFDSVERLEPSQKLRAIDVYQNHELTHRVHY